MRQRVASLCPLRSSRLGDHLASHQLRMVGEGHVYEAETEVFALHILGWSWDRVGKLDPYALLTIYIFKRRGFA